VSSIINDLWTDVKSTVEFLTELKVHVLGINPGYDKSGLGEHIVIQGHERVQLLAEAIGRDPDHVHQYESTAGGTWVEYTWEYRPGVVIISVQRCKDLEELASEKNVALPVAELAPA